MGIDLDLWRARIGLFNASRVPRLRSRVNLSHVSIDASLLTALCGAVLTVFTPYLLLTHILSTSQLPCVASAHAVYTLHPLCVLSSFTSLVPVLRLMSCLLVTIGVITVLNSFGRTLSISGYKISQKMIIILLLSYCLAHLLILAGDVETNPGPERGTGGKHLSSIFHALKYELSAPLRMLPLLVAGVPGAGITTLLKRVFPKVTFAGKNRTTGTHLQAVLTEKGCFELDQAVVVLQQVFDGVKGNKALSSLKEARLVSSKELALTKHTHQGSLPPGFKCPMDYFKDLPCSDFEGYFADKWCTVYLTDMGGQHNFEEIIPAFVTMPSVILLVINLNEDLACKHTCDTTHSGLTPQEVIMRSLSSIDCVIHSLPHVVKPKVLLVVTHTDLISKQQVTSVDDLLQALIRNTEVESLVHFASPTQMIFPVNSLSPNDPGILHLQAVLKHYALESDEFQVTVFLKWLVFSAVLQQLHKPVWTYEQCFQVAGTCGVNTYSEFDNALQFLHTRMGVLRYFPMIKEHRNMVIIKPKYLAEALSDVVTANFSEEKREKELQNTGLLSMELYQTVSKHSNDLLTASKLFALLEYLHVAVRYNQTSAKVFIPCFLSSSPAHDHSASFHSSDIPPLLIHFDCGCCPVGLFSSLAVHLTENKLGSKLQWNLITGTIFRDQISLHVEPCHFTVRLTEFIAYYSVELVSTDVTCKMPLGDLCVEVRHCIENGLKVSTKSMNLTKYSFELALLCPDPESKLHPHPSVVRFQQDQPRHVECVKTRRSWDIPPKSTVWFQCQEKSRAVVVAGDSPVTVTQVPPLGVSVKKPPIEKPTLQELAVIPLEESQWYTLGKTLGLEEGLLKSIQYGTSNPTKRKREMFKNWLNEKDTKVSWHVLLGALRKIGATDTAEVVRSEYGVSDTSGPEEILGDGDDLDAGFVEDVDDTNTKMFVHDGSTAQRAQSLKLPKPPKYMAFEASYQQLMSLVSKRPVDYARRAFSRALIDTLKLDKIRSSLVTDEEKATELLREIGQMIRTSVPQAFERFLLILNTHLETPVVQQLTSMADVYKVLTEFQKLTTSEINLDVLAEEFFNKGLITPSSYEECTQTDENLPKAVILYKQLSKLKASQPFLKLLAAYPSTKDVVETLKQESGTSSPSSEPSQDSSGYLTSRTEELESSLGSTLSKNDLTLTEDVILDTSTCPSLGTSMYPSLESSTSSDQYHSLDSQNGTMVLGSLKEPLSESTLPSLERQSSTVTPFTDTSTPKEKSEKFAVYPFQFQAEAQLLFGDATEKFLVAVEKNDPAAIDSLLRRREVTVDQVLKDGRTGLHLAAANGYHDVVKVLLNHKCTVDPWDREGITPLYLATYYGNYEVMKMLVVACADVNAVTKDGTSVLLHPGSKGYSMVTEYLLENGANPNLADKFGVTPLIAATRKGQRDVVAVLLQHGADVNAVSLETSRTALQEAVHREYTEIVTMLIKAQSAADERSQALFTCKTAEKIRKLVKGGAKVNDRRGDGATPVIVHTDQGNFEVVKVLVELNANVDLQDEAGFSALMIAAKSGNMEILQVLINAEAILDLKSKHGLTALMYAVQNRSEQAAKKLLLAGADGSARDKGGKTVVEMAEERGCGEIVRLLQRQTAVTNTSDPFVHLLSSYLEGSKRSIEPSSSSHGSTPVISRKHTQQRTAAGPLSEMSLVPMSHRVVPKPRSSDIEDSTMRDQLSKAWKRIADLETRIHDLTLQATMEPPPESDLTYLERSRLEEEYRKLKELKKKAEYYAVEAKQTAQRLSAENFKLKEDLSRERHHNELTRKNMIREMEQKMDKNATALDRADARLEVFEQEVNERALQMIRRMSAPTALALQLPGTTTQLEPSFVKDLILKQKIRASFVVIGFAGLPYSGKSTLLTHILEMQHSQEEHARINLPGGLSMFEAVMMKDKINEECRWINSTRLDAEVLAIAVSLAQICAKSQQIPSFADFAATRPGALLFKDPKVDECFQKSFERLKKMMNWVQQQGKMDKLMTSSLTFVNIYDMGVNKAVFEVLSILTSQFKNLLLVNALSLKDAQGDGLHQSPNLKDKERYRGRGDSEITMKLHSSLKYYTEIIAATSRAPQSTVLVGTFADHLTESELQATKTKVLHSVNGRAEAIGIMEAICPGMVTIDARNKEQALEVRAALEGMIERRNFEIDIKLRWIFLRGVLFQTKKLFMSRSEMLVLAKKCGLVDEEELEEFLKLFLISGSLIYSPSEAFPVLQQHIILDPIAFISGLDKLYYIHTSHSIPDNLREDLESTKNGFLSLPLAKHLWSEHDFYLQVLETLGLIVQVNEILKKSTKTFFMPYLRLKHDPTKPDADSNSLIITHSLDALPYRKLSDFVIYLTNLCKDQIEFETDVHYNVIRFRWHTPEANCYVRFRGEFVEIGVKTAESCSQLQHATLCSILKTACIDIFDRMVQDFRGLKYNLAIVCPKSNQAKKRLHFIPFHATQYDCSRLFCPQCESCIEETGIPPARKFWIRAAYQGVSREIFYPEDFLSAAEMGEIVDRLSQQPFETVQSLAYQLGFTRGEFTEKSQGRSIKDLLFFLLLEWKRRSPTNTKQSLALLLMSCGHYTEALRLDPTLPASARPLTPDTLTTNELAFIAQSVAKSWVELARTLGIQETDIQEIQKTYRTHGEQSFQMLERWLHLYSSQQTLPPPLSLIKALKYINYHHLADFIETETQHAVLK